MGDNFQYGDLIFLGLIAVFLVLRLRAMLGKDSGIDPREAWRQATRTQPQEKVFVLPESAIRPQKKEKEEDTALEKLKDNVGVSEGLRAIKQVDAQFSATEFINGSKLAFEWVVGAYSKGERDKLKMLLSDERYKYFSDDLDVNLKEGKFPETTLVAITAADITEAGMHDGRAQITVQFTSEQIHVVRDKDKNVISGDPSAIEHVVDIWTFERDPASHDPNWKIIAT